MFTKQQRLIVSIVAVAAGIFLLLFDNNPVGWLLFLMAAFLLYGYFQSQPVPLLFHYVSRGQLDQADRLLAEIKHPETLPPNLRAYYELALGWMNLRRGHGAIAEQSLNHALKQGLRITNDTALAHALLAHTYAQQGNPSLARSYLDKAKAFQHNSLVEAEILALETEL
jgi:tetratricopeptide (TPR) repeat protein